MADIILSCKMSIKDEGLDEFERAVDHHVEALLNLDGWPEIESIWDAQVDNLEGEENENDTTEDKFREILNEHCKRKFSVEETYQFLETLSLFHKSAITAIEYNGMNTGAWFGTLVAILDEHKCKNKKKTLNALYVALHEFMLKELNEYSIIMLYAMKGKGEENDKN